MRRVVGALTLTRTLVPARHLPDGPIYSQRRDGRPPPDPTRRAPLCSPSSYGIAGRPERSPFSSSSSPWRSWRFLLALLAPTFNRAKTNARAAVAEKVLRGVLGNANANSGTSSRPTEFNDVATAAIETVRGGILYTAVRDTGAADTRATSVRISVLENENGLDAAFAFDGGCTYVSTTSGTTTIESWHAVTDNVYRADRTPPTSYPGSGGNITPSEPRSLALTPLDTTTVRVTFNPPVNDGGSAVRQYRFIAYSGGAPIST